MLRKYSAVQLKKEENVKAWQALRAQTGCPFANWSVHFFKFDAE